MKGLVKLSFNEVFSEYYEKILNFCYAKIGDKQLAEDCTQEVFLAFSKKMHSLRLDTNVAAWLYGAAKNEIKRCFRKNMHNNVALDDIGDVPQKSEENHILLNDILTEDEYRLLEDYYLYKEDIAKLAADRKLTAAAMYQRIHRIKQKIINNSDKFYNISKE